MTEQTPLHIVELTAENFKRLKTVAIRPDGHVVQITGANGQGKTSVLDALLGVFAGTRELPLKPIRTGEESAEVRVDLDDFIVTRRFKTSDRDPKGWTTDLIVEAKAGGRMKSPQDVLNAFIGEFSFDPLAFTRLKPDEQFEALKTFVPDFDFNRSAALDRSDYAERTEINRQAKALRTQAEAIVLPAGRVPAEVDVAALEDKLAQAGTHNADVERRRSAREAAQNRLSAIEQQIDALTAERAELEDKLAQAGELPEPIDTAEVQAALAAGRQANQARAQAKRRDELIDQAKELEKKSDELTRTMEGRERERQEAISRAKMPVPGLGFHPQGYITLEGEPFSQASDAQQLRASIAIAAAKNPRLRVARVRDGSLLDEHAMRALEDFARENDLQVWIERVDTSGTVGFVLENGELKDAGTAPQAPKAEPEEAI